MIKCDNAASSCGMFAMAVVMLLPPNLPIARISCLILSATLTDAAILAIELVSVLSDVDKVSIPAVLIAAN